MRKLLFYTVAIFAALSMAGTALAESCTVTAFATCTAVTADFYAPYGDAVHIDVTVSVDGIVRELIFDGEEGSITIEHPGLLLVLLKWRGVLTIGERVVPFSGSRSLERSGTDCDTPSPSPSPSGDASTPPPSHASTTPAPPLAFTGGPSPWILASAGGLALMGLDLLLAARRRHA